MIDLLFILVICVGAIGATVTNKLTVTASMMGAAIASVIFIGTGWTGFVLMTTFFLIGTLATSWKKKFKQSIGLAQENQGRRNAGQVMANAGVAGILAVGAILFPAQSSFFLLMIAGSFSSATADTVSSELGSVYGKKFYDILSFSKGQRGLDGVISFEGTLSGVAGSCVIAAIYSLTEGWNITFLWIIVAGTAGNLADSYLGATLERKRIIGNDTVNFLNTGVGAVFILLLSQI